MKQGFFLSMMRVNEVRANPTDEKQPFETKLAMNHLCLFSEGYTVSRCPLFFHDKQFMYKLVGWYGT